MASTDQNVHKKTTAKENTFKKPRQKAQGVKTKRKWIPEHKMFQGSIKEGWFFHEQQMTTATTKVLFVFIIYIR